MRLNSLSVIPLLASSYSDEVLYFSNSTIQALSLTGGKTPVTGRHSTIDSPESVRRVAPPTMTMTTRRAAIELSHNRIARRCALAAAVFATLCISSSIAVKGRLCLCNECLIRAFKILALHTDGLRLRLGFDGLVEAHVPFLVDAAFGHGMREGRTIGKRFCQGLCLS